RTVRDYVPGHVRHLTGIPAARLERAAELIGTASTLVSACLQGVYQSNQATAAACQVNNVNLVRGLIGKPGCGVMQMNGQPTAQNTRETGCDGEFPFFLNWQNPDHIRRWAELWNVDPAKLPHHHTHAHAMEIFRHAELGSVKFLWVIGTNPAVSLPDLHKIRRTLGKSGLLVVVSDAFLTETARLADVVLPVALWGEKTGTFTNVDRTVHISHQAIDPPGEARSDLDIFLDFARRMDFRDQAGAPLVKWKNAAGAFDHWARCSAGWLCDYSGLSHAKLTGGSGIQWPCNAAHAEGTERIYTDHVFPTAAAVTQEFGHDIETGAAQSPEYYKANDPAGRAILKAANYIPPREEPDAEYPFFLTTGRVVYQFHTRTKTGRAPELNAAATDVFAEIAAEDAGRLGVKDGDLLEVRSRRGTVYAPAKVGDILPGHVFVPFHYGYWDGDGGEHHRAANELTISSWDAVSKQPHYKYAAVRIRKADGPSLADRVTVAGSQVIDRAKELADKALSSAHLPRSRVPDYLGAVRAGHREFALACRSLMAIHLEEPGLQAGLEMLARFSDEAAGALEPFVTTYGEHSPREPHHLRQMLFPAARPGAFGILRDLQALAVLATEVQTATTILGKAAQALRDAALHAACEHLDEQVRRQLAWLLDHIQHR
ncbi:MAG: molybdopterin oxidoreductase family protein, partial [Gemmataceae bacterium]